MSALARRARRLRAAGRLALVTGMLVSLVSAALLISTDPVEAAPSAAAATESSSEVTIDWATLHPDETNVNFESFKDLSVTVSQTKSLVNQGIRVNWSGAKPTSAGDFSTNYMQIMQCWGDAADGPTPQQCQWGATSASFGNLLGTQAASRDLNEGEDAQQVYSDDLKYKAPLTNPNLRVFGFPFSSVKTPTKSTFQVSDFFTSATTNEVSAARTGRDGTGLATFEVQTSLEAPHLGCGALVNGDPRSCWLVLVPRGEINLDGSPASSASSGRIAGSPLSASAWNNRVVVPLGFQPVSQSCAIGNAEQRVVGSEVIADAITSWQSPLCGKGTTFGFSQLGDSEGRRQILSDVDGGSKLAFVTDPITAEEAGDNTIVYGPVAQSAIVVAYNIDYSLNSDASNFAKNGTPVTSLSLNARLVAKLLTQSYKFDVPGQAVNDPVVSANPRSIVTDPEFIALNPEFAGFTILAAPDGLMVALGSSDANAHVWSWLRSDPLAKSFLAGEADDWGMKINPSYKSLGLDTLPTDSFPKADLTTFRSGNSVPEPGFGTLDMRPYMNDMHEAASRALKADANVRTLWDETKAPPSFVSSGPQLPGSRFMLAITDAASASRYGLNSAKLVNGAGQAVEPTTKSITKAVSTMKEGGESGVLIADPADRTPGAYPLTMMTYAAVNVCASSETDLAAYSMLLEYAVGDGQVSGDARGKLPRGYVPLGSDLKKETKSAIEALAPGSETVAACTPTPTPTPTPTKTKKPDAPATFEPVPETETESTPVPDASVVPTADPEEAAEVLTTDDAPLEPGRLGLAAALALGVPTMIAGPFLTRRGRRLAKLSELDD